MTVSATCALDQISLRSAITDTYDYDAFGNKVNSTGTTPNNYLYRGEAYDSDLGLYYLRARWMNPITGRFMSRDPNEGKPFDPKTLHKYLYVGGDPVNFIDPFGKDAEEVGLTTKTIALSAIVDLGSEVTITGTAEITEGSATFYIQLIQGTLRNPFGVMQILTEAATALGASDLYIVATFANAGLQAIAIQRYGFVTVGGVEVWWSQL